jgi:acyl carrier protein
MHAAPLPDGLEESARLLVGDVLGLGNRAALLVPETPMLGSLPELDSMAVATLLAAAEERFGILIDDGSLSAESFETFGGFLEFLALQGAKAA